MNFIDAYKIVDDYVDSLAKEPKNNEHWKRTSTLHNSKKEICDAYKLFFTHALFFHVIPNDQLKLYERSLNHVGDFIDDKLIDEIKEIENTLNNRSIFTKLRDNAERKRLEERKSEIVNIATRSVMDGFNCGTDLGNFIEWMVPEMNKAKDKCKELSDEEFNKKFFDILGNYVCDVYEKTQIERDYNDTEYFWSFDVLYKNSNKSKYDYLFSKYKEYISELYLMRRYNN